MHSKHLTWGNEKTFPETCQLGVFVRIRHRNIEKNKNKHQISEKRQHYLKRVFWVFFFQLFTYQNAKTCPKHTLWKNRTLGKTCVFSVLSLLVNKTQKLMQSNHHGKTKWFSRETFIECFSTS